MVAQMTGNHEPPPAGASPEPSTAGPSSAAAPRVVHLAVTRDQAAALLYAARATEPRTRDEAHRTLLGAIGVLCETLKAHDAGTPLFAEPEGAAV